MQTTTTTTTTVGLCLLPSDLLHDIFLRLPLPYLHRLRSVSTSLTSLLTSRDFRRLHRSLSDSTWLFLLTKRPPSRSSLLRGFHRRSLRWFTFPLLPPDLDNDLYFLSASGNFFLFTSNSLLRLVAVDLAAATATARALPLCPLGPRGTSSWRRSGFKLLSSSSSSSFRFLFADLHRGRPALFEYSSATDAWRSVLAESSDGGQHVTRGGGGGGGGGTIFLNVSDFVLVVAGVNDEEEEAVPVVYYYTPRMLEGLGAVGRLHVYGDGMAAVVSTVASGGGRRSVTSVELWGPRGGQEWEMVTRVPEGLFGSGDYGVMKGCLEERDGVVWLVLVSNLRGDWAIVWLGYHRRTEEWEWVPVADPGAKGFNMAGIAVGTSFLGHWPSSSSSASSSSSSS
ncbi:F-box domain containing protein [Iris pallida]|uniref:F-box domain containing protein n=1 Tax=Iris pallida TaxID=29817 RepID=A0AAX6HNK6_IRIPA|nr:F-box domain containing protein [Iris pallida]